MWSKIRKIYQLQILIETIYDNHIMHTKIQGQITNDFGSQDPEASNNLYNASQNTWKI